MVLTVFPLKIMKTASNVILSHLANIINKHLAKHRFAEKAKTALVKPIYKSIEKTIREKNKKQKTHKCTKWVLKDLWEIITSKAYNIYR